MSDTCGECDGCQWVPCWCCGGDGIGVDDGEDGDDPECCEECNGAGVLDCEECT